LRKYAVNKQEANWHEHSKNIKKVQRPVAACANNNKELASARLEKHAETYACTQTLL
jgi:hypothetical protein